MSERSGLGVVVVATDFSATAELAQQHAVALARRQGARLILVHGHTMGSYWVGPANPIAIPPDYEATVLQTARTHLETAAGAIQEAGLEAEVRLVAASGPEAVAQVATEVDADLVVTGTRGHTGIKHLILGSAAEEIVRSAHRPVLAVHPGDVIPDHERIRIVLPTDFSDDARTALEQTVALLGDSPDHCELVLVHVIHTPALMAPMVGDLAMQEVFVRQARDEASPALEGIAGEMRAQGYSVETVVQEGDPADAISAVAADRGAALIAMGTRGLTGFKRLVQGSVADRTIRHARCPVLTVPKAEA